ncbi:MAG: hypothetical protein U0871_08815 [Gemmataceae bacterium]
MLRIGAGVLAAVTVGLTVGCGGGGGGVTEDTPKNALLDLAEGLKTTAADGKKPPAKLAELDQIEPMIPLAGPAIRSGAVVYLWGGAYNQSGTKVVAYEKKAETEGGLVLLQNGTVKPMTADELKGAEKAGKK